MLASDNDITLFAKTNFRNREVPFGIRRDDRRRHMYIIGKTGMGKTTLIENMVIQDILNGHGVCFVDPHGDSVEKVLDYIPSNRVNDVVYLNPADADFPIAFNPLEAVDPKHKHLVASGLMGVFTKIWAGVWSPRMEYILLNTILALLDSPGNTMLGIARIYVDKAYRKKIVDNIKDPIVKTFWVDEFANYQDKFRTEAVAPIQNKVGQFLSNAIIRNIVGQTKSTIDLRDIMDNKKILLLNLSKGRVGEDSSALLGAMIITKLQLAAMSRVDVPEEERADFYLYVDEFQNFATESFANILSEARKYRLNLIVAHQYIGQLIQDRNTIVRDAIFGNVGTMIAFRVGADDAEFLEKEFEPTYTMNDLVNLSKFCIYLKLMINGVASNPFSAITLPPISEPTGNTEKVIKVSRERYGTPKFTVETKISRWLGAEFHAESARAESESMDEEGVSEELRFKYDKPAAPPPAKPAAQPRSIAPIVSQPKPEERQKFEAPPRQELKFEQQAPEYRPPDLNIPAKHARTPHIEVDEPQKERASKEGKHERRTENNRREERRTDERRQVERREKQTAGHPGRRSTDKQRPKNDNPIWDTVSKMATEKLQQRVQKANEAIESLSRSLQESVVKQPQAKERSKPANDGRKLEPQDQGEAKQHELPKTDTRPFKVPEPMPAPKLSRSEPVEVPSFSAAEKQPRPAVPKSFTPDSITQETVAPEEEEMDLGTFGEPELPSHHIHPEDHTLSPHVDIQREISSHGQVEPGQTVKFDE